LSRFAGIVRPGQQPLDRFVRALPFPSLSNDGLVDRRQSFFTGFIGNFDKTLVHQEQNNPLNELDVELVQIADLFYCGHPIDRFEHQPNEILRATCRTIFEPSSRGHIWPW
jgi:hypothetical protein